MKALFLVKKTEEYGGYTLPTRSGLRNSAKFVVDALNRIPGMEASLEFCVDGNDIDNKLHRIRPDIVFYEAVWITPAKMREIHLLYPSIKFVVRLHSKIPFLAIEGMAITWIKEYQKIPNVSLSFNNIYTSDDMNSIGIVNTYLPNIYRDVHFPKRLWANPIHIAHTYPSKEYYRFGCFGAIRPLKNQLNQAVAAIMYAESRGATAKFYINATRVEQGGDNVLKNLRGLFDNSPHQLVELQWFLHQDFLDTIATMDVALQVSLTETFNIVTADCVSESVPVVVSREIDWLDHGDVDPNSAESIFKRITHVLNNKTSVVANNLQALTEYNFEATRLWINYLGI